MKLREYQLYVPTTMNKLGTRLQDEVHMMLGAGSELLSELPKAISRHDLVNITEELGDIEWFLCNYANIWDIELQDKPMFATNPGSVEALQFVVGEMMDITKREFAYGAAKYNKQDVTIELRESMLKKAFQEVFNIAKACGLDIEVVRDKNKNKLEQRYGKGAGFSSEKALNRDSAAEEKALGN